jgi:undecaprenyl-diphosphatase
MSIVEQLAAADHALFFLVNHTLANPLLDAIFTNATEAKFWIAPGLVAAVLFILKKKREALIVLGLALVTVAITDPLANQLLKPIFHRDRPCPPGFFIEGGRFLCGSKHSLSFPSSHAMNIFAQAMLLTLFYPRLAWVYFLFAGFIGYSRIYVGVHYPGDVAAGAVFGMACAGIVVISWRSISAAWRRRRGRAQPLPPRT